MKTIFNTRANFNKEEFKEKRKIFNSYPIYLKHSVLFEGDDFNKIREMELLQKFQVYDDLRERGNKKFIKGQYEKALSFYEQVLFFEI